MSLPEAVEQAVKSCIQEGILADILSKNRAEVRNLILYEYDEQKQLQLERKEGFAEGKTEGIAEGIAKGIAKGEARIVSMIRKKWDKGREAPAIAEELELKEEYVNEVLKLLKEEPYRTDLEIAGRLMIQEPSGDK